MSSSSQQNSRQANSQADRAQSQSNRSTSSVLENVREEEDNSKSIY